MMERVSLLSKQKEELMPNLQKQNKNTKKPMNQEILIN